MEVLGGAIYIVCICLFAFAVLGFLFACELIKAHKVKYFRSGLTPEQLKLIDTYEQNTKLTISDFKRIKK